MIIRRFVVLLLFCASFAAPVFAQGTDSSSKPREPYLQGLTASDADTLIRKVQDLQAKLKAGEQIYFDLLSGAPATYEATQVSPREAFLQLSFDKPFSVERIESHNPLWQPHRLTYQPDGPGQLVWDVEVVLGINGQVERIEMFNRPPHPF